MITITMTIILLKKCACVCDAFCDFTRTAVSMITYNIVYDYKTNNC